MDEMEVKKQVQQMVHFIRQEAEEKANEISISAEEEFNIQKLQLVEADKKKIREEYGKKERIIDVQKRIELSKLMNVARLKVLQAQDDLVQGMKDAAERQLVNVSLQPNSYVKLLDALIIQGFFRLNEPFVQIRCRKEDLSMVNEAMKSAITNITTFNVFGVNPIMDLDKKNFLPSPPQVGFYGSTCYGGVVMASKDGCIVLDNTLDARLEIVFKHLHPEIRKKLFPPTTTMATK
ncbi:unnamed protein product [Sphagnum jensenii]|uniref:Vacuolar ATP synthase subunit E n=1 Tax=Sphagnum jensenii TaxID=128206 RepID=A0ABP0X6V5_9BRYO